MSSPMSPPNSEQQAGGGATRESPKRKLTVWRAINTIVLLSVGTTKAVMAFQGNPIANAFDMMLGVFWALM